MLRYRWRRLAQLFGEFVDRQLTASECPQHPDPGGVGQHAKHFDDQVDLVFGNHSWNVIICVHTQIITYAGTTRLFPRAAPRNRWRPDRRPRSWSHPAWP